jgi:hypothetical protein
MDKSLQLSEERINEIGSFFADYIIQSVNENVKSLNKNQLQILLEENYQDFIKYAKNESMLLDSEKIYLKECADDIDAYIQEEAMDVIIDSQN